MITILHMIVNTSLLLFTYRRCGRQHTFDSTDFHRLPLLHCILKIWLRSAIVQLCSCAILQSYNCPIVQMCNCAIVQMCKCAIIQLCSCAILQLCNCVNVQMCNHTVVQMCNRTIVLLHIVILIVHLTVAKSSQVPNFYFCYQVSWGS